MIGNVSVRHRPRSPALAPAYSLGPEACALLRLAPDLGATGIGGPLSPVEERVAEQARLADVSLPMTVGVFKLTNLSDAQEAGVTLFWEHDLKTLREFLESAQT